MLNKQISSLFIATATNKTGKSMKDMKKNLFMNILTIFTNLLNLNFCLNLSTNFDEISFARFTPTFSSSTLMELHISVNNFCDCLLILDGRFNQLRTFYVKIHFIVPRPLQINDNVTYFRRARASF
jgi:hypothetical protein